MKTTHQTRYLKDYCAPPFFVDHIDLTFDLYETDTRVTSSMKIRKNLDVADENTSLVFDLKQMQIESVVADGMVLPAGGYETSNDSFKLFRTPDAFTLEITSVIDPLHNTSLEGLYMSDNMFCTQCEAEGFRKITPFPDRPDIMSTYSCTIIADKTAFPVLLSNGNPVKSGDLENNRHYAVWQDPFKKPCYLFALVAGDLSCLKDRFVTKSGRAVDLHIFSKNENIDQCAHAMTSLKQAMKWDEEKFGREYDLDLYQIVAVDDFNAGAMENKGLNIFNTTYVLADPDTATDQDFLNIQAVIAHEYFHNWSGNRVTLKNWFQLSLKEGLTVFRDQEFSADMHSRGVKRISDVRQLRFFQFPEDSGPMAHPVRPESYIEMNNFYTMTVYEKGAEVVRMVCQILGWPVFRKAMDRYFETFDGMAVTIEDFLSVMAEESGIDLTQFKRWYTQSGTPRVKINRSYDPTSKNLTLTFEQHTHPDRNQEVKEPLHIPVKLGLLDKTGKDLVPEAGSVLHLKKEREEFVFHKMPSFCVPSLFREFSAPVIIESDLTGDELAFLMARDTDEFNRYDAARTLFQREIEKLVGQIHQKTPMTVSGLLADAFKATLNRDDTDRAFIARTITIPDENEIKNHFDTIDVDAIHHARQFLVTSLAAMLKDNFAALVEKCSQSDPKDLSGSAMADRSLKNTCLSYIGSLETEQATRMIHERFTNAGNMTDEIAALSILSHIESDLTRAAIQAFYEKWRNNPLVMNKWFAVQAQADRPDTLDTVASLIAHPAFSIKNPNKVRSLIGVLVMHNPYRFHSPDGRGYAFLTEQVLTVDKINPQIASRLAGGFNLWKRYDNKRQQLMKHSLQTILASDNLSKNVYEIVSRALES